MKSLFLILIPLLFVIKSFADTTFVEGTVSGEWTIEGNPYIVQSDLWIPQGQSLNINPGVRVEFWGAYLIGVDGSMNCLGELGDSIYFTQDTVAYPERWQGIQYNSVAGQPSILRFTVFENAEASAGAVNVTTQPMAIQNCTFRDCLRIAIKVSWQDALIENCVITRCRFNGNGTGLTAINANVRATNTEWTDCSSADGGAIVCWQSELTLERCLIARNRATFWGGGIFADSSWITLSSCVFDSNTALTGGACFISNFSNVVIDRCVFTENSVIRGNYVGQSGALHLPAWGSQRITHTLFHRNRGSNGSAMLIQGLTRMEHCVFVQNSPNPAIGGDVDTLSYTSFDVRPLTRNAYVHPAFGVLSSVNINGDSIDIFGNFYSTASFDPNGPYGEFSLSFESHLIDAGNPDGPPDADGTIPDLGPYPYHQLHHIDDLTLTRLEDTSSLRLQWTAVPDAASYWVYRSPSGEFSMETAIFLGSDPATEFVDIDVLANPLAQGTYVVIASQASATSAEPLLHRRLADR